MEFTAAVSPGDKLMAATRPFPAALWLLLSAVTSIASGW
jgi:hypothetical protein